VNRPSEVLNIVVESDSTDSSSPDENRRRRVVRTLVIALMMFGVGVALTTVRLPYLVLEPGDTFETEEFVAVDGLDSFPSPDGEVRFVTVTQRRLTPVGLVMSVIDESEDVFHEDELLRGRTLDEQREENAQLMLSSQNTAISAALVELGFEVAEPNGAVVLAVTDGGPMDGVVNRNDVISSVLGEPVATFDELYDAIEPLEVGSDVTLIVGRAGEETRQVVVTLTDDTAAFLGVARASDDPDDGSGALVESIVEGGPVDGLLESGDRVVEVDGTGVTGFAELVDALNGLRSGDEVEVVVDRDGGRVSNDVVLGSRVLERLGIADVQTQFRDADLPFEIDITTEEIGGPSAGLAFTLTILDVLTAGELTGGADIVVTGTIAPNGVVGPIGGVRQKAFAAKDSGAAIFIVPADNLAEAQDAVDGLRIEGVSTLDEALAIIDEFGGNALELPALGQL